jgi:trimeric autotransporter adhesin
MARHRSTSLLFLVLTACALHAACGSSTTTTTTTAAGPTPVRCAVQVAPAARAFAAAGGEASVGISAARECQWTAASDADWIAIAPPLTGQGEGTVQFAVRANAVPVARRGTITVEGQQLEVTQQAGACSYDLDRASDALPAAGGSGAAAVRTHAVCTWSASSDAPWLVITEGGSGTGPGTVRYTAAGNTGAERRATLTIAGRSIEVTQAGDAQAPAPPPPTPGPAPDPAPPPACSFSVAPLAHEVGADAVTRTVQVTTDPACRWTAESQSPWIVVTAGAEQQGPGEVRFSVSENTGAARVGRLLVAGRTVTVTQAERPAAPPPPAPEPCRYELSQSDATATAEGGTGSVRVTASRTDCAWTATSDAAWLSITAGATGSGTGEVRYTVAANTAEAERVGTITAAGLTFRVRQASAPVASPPPDPPPAAEPCTYELSSSEASVAAEGGTGSVRVTASRADCAWTAASDAAWLSITAGATGSGTGEVRYTAAANTAEAERAGTITAAGLTFRVRQAGAAAAPPPAPDPPPATITVRGEVTDLSGTCPDLRFTIDDTRVRTTGDTTFHRGNCRQVARRDTVEVTGQRQADGVVLASRVEIVRASSIEEELEGEQP